jgi:hypothetical protein
MQTVIWTQEAVQENLEDGHLDGDDEVQTCGWCSEDVDRKLSSELTFQHIVCLVCKPCLSVHAEDFRAQ